jgi:hypothetical protein
MNPKNSSKNTRFWNGLQSIFTEREMGIDKGLKYLAKKNGLTIDLKMGDPNGWCVAWSAFYLDQRLKNLKVSPAEVKKKVMEGFKSVNDLKKVRNVLRTLATKQFQEINKVNKLWSDFTPFERALMVLEVDRGIKDLKNKKKTTTIDVINEIYKKLYPDDEDKALEERNNFLKKVWNNLVKRGLKPAHLNKWNDSFQYTIFLLWRGTIAQYVAKELQAENQLLNSGAYFIK